MCKKIIESKSCWTEGEKVMFLINDKQIFSSKYSCGDFQMKISPREGKRGGIRNNQGQTQNETIKLDLFRKRESNAPHPLAKPNRKAACPVSSCLV